MKKFLRLIKVISSTLVMLFVTLYLVLIVICYGPSESARNILVTTLLETGQLKFVVSLLVTDETVIDIVSSNSLQDMSEDVNSDLIEIALVESSEIEIKEVSGSNFFATVMIIPDPSTVTVATTYPFSEYGKTLDELVDSSLAIAGINGGLYQSSGNTGGYPMGVVVSGGKILYNNPYDDGYHLIGFDEDNVLQIIDMTGMDTQDVIELVESKNIRDAVTFQEEFTDANNHFVKLVINGEERVVNGLGSGANPRTAIGQRADGTVIFVVTDGRGANGHLGATASDLIEIMLDEGAVNAANLDGGSSSTMYYNNEYLMTSVTFYYSNSSWRLPTAFVVS